MNFRFHVKLAIEVCAHKHSHEIQVQAFIFSVDWWANVEEEEHSKIREAKKSCATWDIHLDIRLLRRFSGHLLATQSYKHPTCTRKPYWVAFKHLTYEYALDLQARLIRVPTVNCCIENAGERHHGFPLSVRVQLWHADINVNATLLQELCILTPHLGTRHGQTPSCGDLMACISCCQYHGVDGVDGVSHVAEHRKWVISRPISNALGVFMLSSLQRFLWLGCLYFAESQS